MCFENNEIQLVNKTTTASIRQFISHSLLSLDAKSLAKLIIHGNFSSNFLLPMIHPYETNRIQSTFFFFCKQIYLSQFGYLPAAASNPASGNLIDGETWTNAIKEFQSFAGLNATGTRHFNVFYTFLYSAI